MRKINKPQGTLDVPLSLRAPFRENFPNGKVPKKAKTTALRRHEVIRNGAFVDSEPFSSRYRQSDTKNSLKLIYLQKCVFCEQRMEFAHIEHYRPKKIYFWLAFSWDNLLYCCPMCNHYKDVQFRVRGGQATFSVTLGNLKNIHRLGANYDSIELPDLVNPEVTDPTGMLTFYKNGRVTSSDARFQYTIDTCKLDRDDLQVFRMGILQKFREDIESQLREFVDSPSNQSVSIQTIVSQFVRDSRNAASDFTAFRNYMLQHWLAEEIKNIKNRV